MTQKILYGAVALVVGWILYLACTDVATGDLDVPGSADMAFFRVGHGFQQLVGSAENSIQETNQDMQDVADGRNDLNDRRIERDKKGK